MSVTAAARTLLTITVGTNSHLARPSSCSNEAMNLGDHIILGTGIQVDGAVLAMRTAHPGWLWTAAATNADRASTIDSTDSRSDKVLGFAGFCGLTANSCQSKDQSN